MRLYARALALALAALILAQPGVALAHAVGALAGVWVVEICAPGVTRTALVDASGQEVPPPEPVPAALLCLACPGAVQGVAPAPSSPALRAPVAAPAPEPRWRAAPASRAARAAPPPYSGRAPPTHSA